MTGELILHPTQAFREAVDLDKPAPEVRRLLEGGGRALVLSDGAAALCTELLAGSPGPWLVYSDGSRWLALTGPALPGPRCCCSCHKPKPKVQGVYEYPRGSGDWWVRIPLGGRKYRREKVGDYQQAVRRLRQHVAKARARTGPTVEEAFERFFALHKKDSAYHSAARNLLSYLPAGSFLQELAEVGVLREWQKHRASSVKPGTVNREMAFLSGVFRQAVEDKHLEHNPIGGGLGCLPYLRVPGGRTRWITEAEEVLLRQHLTPDVCDLMTLVVNTGLRRKEAWRLRWDDWTDDVLHVDVSKNGRARYIPLNHTAREVLMRRRARGLPRPFPAKSVDTYANRFARAAAELGLAGVTLHVLRHTFGTRLARAGVQQRVIQHLMGHLSGRQTERYTHVANDQLCDAVARLAPIVARPVAQPAALAPTPAPPTGHAGAKRNPKGIYEYPKGSGHWWARLPLAPNRYTRRKFRSYEEACAAFEGWNSGGEA